MKRMLTMTLALAVLLWSGHVWAQAEAEAELQRLEGKVDGFKVVEVTPGDTVNLKADQALTIERLRGVELDPNPPELGEAPQYDRRQTDTFAPGEAPYEAKDIKPFRFKYFNNEFNYGGWHNFKMTDYASTRGFNILYPYTRKPAEMAHLPDGTEWLKWGGFINWHKEMTKTFGADKGRYDQLIDNNALDKIMAMPKFKKLENYKWLMIDMEHGPLPPDKLKEQPWYKRGLEKKYYQGYAVTYIGPVRAAKKNGWPQVGIYGWQPVQRDWHGLRRGDLVEMHRWRWDNYGKDIYKEVDVIYNSVYNFYWTAQNVSYTLANIDANMQLVRESGKPKPVRPYYWTLLHGGGGGNRWYKNMPQANEEVRAMTALGFFTGFDGFDTWNWSGTGNHHSMPEFNPGRKKANYFGTFPYLMLKDEFAVTSADGKARTLKRYDVIHVNKINADGTVTFQVVDKTDQRGNWGIRPDQPSYTTPGDQLHGHIRAQSDPVAGMIEGMALVKPVEYILRHGEVKIHVSAQQQWKDVLPIVRHVQLGKIHVLATYDPKVLFEGAKGRAVTVQNINGKGLSVRLAADDQTRLYVLREK